VWQAATSGSARRGGVIVFGRGVPGELGLRNQLALVTSLLIAWFIISAVFVLQLAVIG